MAVATGQQWDVIHNALHLRSLREHISPDLCQPAHCGC